MSISDDSTSLANHTGRSIYGSVPGVPVLATFVDRKDCSRKGVHRPIRAGIDGGTRTNARSIVLSGGYADRDNGNNIVYTGQGGHTIRIDDKSKQLKEQVVDQQWERGNQALRNSLTSGQLVRVIRGAALDSIYAPLTGYRYDGLYKVIRATRYVPERESLFICEFELEVCPCIVRWSMVRLHSAIQREPGQAPIPILGMVEDLHQREVRAATHIYPSPPSGSSDDDEIPAT